jgi:hypothetical protein
MTKTPDEEIAEIKIETFESFKDSRRIWIIEERGADFIIHTWTGSDWIHGSGVGPSISYPTLRRAASRLLQLLGVGPVAPQTWPEAIGIGSVSVDDET